MTHSDDSSPRRVSPRRWTLIGTLAATGLAVTQPGPLAGFLTGPALAQSPAQNPAGEAGEAGESGVSRSEGPAAYLTELGLFEAAHRIVAQLYTEGETDLAREHLEASHHAWYDEIEPGLAAHGASGFSTEAGAFSDAVMSGAPAPEVAQALERVLNAIAAARAAAAPTPFERVLSMRDLVRLAAADFDSGVAAGVVVLAQEYRDAWGFVETARLRAEALAASDDADLAKAGQAVLVRLDATRSLFPELTATRSDGDPSLLHGAAAWIEIIALGLK